MNPTTQKQFKPYRLYVNSDGYVVATDGKTARRYHRWLYEASFGSIPPGHDVHHIDGDRRNNSLDNLAVMPRGEHRRMHNALRIDAIREQVRRQLRDDRGRFVDLKNAQAVVCGTAVPEDLAA